jgi:hypothetical protein
MQIESPMRSEQRQETESSRVITFRPRAAKSLSTGSSTANLGASPVADLQEYHQAREKEDYRHRMVVNALALAFCTLLAVAGIWLVNEIAEMKRVQDCLLSGRTGCVPLEISGPRRP